MADRETELMLLVKAGDRAAFEEIFRLYQKPLANYLYRLTGNRARSEDLLHHRRVASLGQRVPEPDAPLAQLFDLSVVQRDDVHDRNNDRSVSSIPMSNDL